MKYLLKSTLLLIAMYFSIYNLQAQWSPSTLNQDTYRNGNVGIGVNSPSARLQISRTFFDQGGPAIFNPNTNNEDPPISLNPHLRFNSVYEINGSNAGASVWDIEAPGSLNFSYLDENTLPTLAMSLSQEGLTVRGNRLTVGNENMRLTVGKSQSIFGANSYHLGFGVKQAIPGSAGLNGSYFGFGSSNVGTGGAIIQGDANGNILFISKPDNEFQAINYNQNFDYTGMIITGSQDVLIGTSELINHPTSGQDYKLFVNGGMVSNELKVEEKILIGTNNKPEYLDSEYNYKLVVNGGIVSKEIKVRSDFADYVFEKDYPLLPLKKVASHIQDYGHLHNTPSAEEIQKKGLNVGEITTNQQEKIEELFLHLIAMEKRMDELEKENKLLKEKISDK